MKRRIISMILCFAIVACFFQLFASTAVAVGDSGSYPVLIVRGVDINGLYLDFGTENQRSCLGEIDAAGITKTLILATAKGLINNDMDSAVDEILIYAHKILDGLACDNTGASLYNVGCYKYPDSVGTYEDFPYADENEMGIIKAAVEHYGGDKVYFFNYDWRMNPQDIAHEIAATVNKVISETGKEKVNLVSASMGGVMTVAYISEYGYNKLNKCVFLSSAFYGAKVVSELFQGKVEVSPEALYNFACEYLGENSGLGSFFAALKYFGVFDAISSLANDFIGRYQERFYNELLKECFCYTLSYWALILPEDYDACVDYIFGGDEGENAAFIAKTQELQQMMAQRDSLLKQAADNGVKIYVITSYNNAHFPFYPSAVLTGDNGLETTYMSGGALAANYGETLPDEILNSNSQYISSDGVIDASTCLFPDSTWFIKDGPHVGFNYGTDCSEFLLWLLDYDGQATILSSPDYPQFMQTNKNLFLSLLEQKSSDK